jgi:hypothetical protein
MVSMIKELVACRTLSEVSLVLMQFAGDFFGRTLILRVRQDQIIGLGQSGFASNGKEPDFIQKISIPLYEDSMFGQALRDGRYLGKWPDTKWEQYLASHWGGEVPGEVFVAPLMGGKKVEAFLYGDDFPGRQGVGNTEDLEVFMKVASLVLTSPIQPNPDETSVLV